MSFIFITLNTIRFSHSFLVFMQSRSVGLFSYSDSAIFRTCGDVSWPSCNISSPSALVWILEHFSDDLALIGSEKCGDKFPETLPSVLGSEWTLALGWVSVLLPYGLSWASLCHPSQLSSVSFPFALFPGQRGRFGRSFTVSGPA